MDACTWEVCQALKKLKRRRKNVFQDSEKSLLKIIQYAEIQCKFGTVGHISYMEDEILDWQIWSSS